MFDEVKTDVANPSAGPERVDKTPARTRGSSSPFRCITSLVQQMNQEKDQELSSARLRIEELESLAACRYKEVNKLSQLSKDLLEHFSLVTYIHFSDKDQFTGSVRIYLFHVRLQ